jgi:ribosomal protein RSM22 (predicted rRNA methylase)
MKPKKRLRLSGRNRAAELAPIRPLEPSFQALLDDLARARSWPTTKDVARLGAAVAQLSAVYNSTEKRSVEASGPDALAARLLFSFPRDVPKSAAALREVVASGRLRAPTGDAHRPLRVLDLGCGLGASTWGLARLLAPVHLQCTWIERDMATLQLASALAERAHEQGVAPGIRLDFAGKNTFDVSTFRPDFGGKTYDVILAGQVLSELDRKLEPEERVAAHAERLAGWMRALAPEGLLVVVEPALRERTRHLHAVRDHLLAAHAEAHVVYPCLHDEPCPALWNEREWCHEDLPIDLPEWLEPVAKAAGLRWQGLGFAPLVLERRAEKPAPAREVRVVSDALDSKGQREAFVCGHVEMADVAGGPGLLARRVRVAQMERDAGPASVAWDALFRFDRLRFDPPLMVKSEAPEGEATPPRVRLAPGTSVVRVAAGEDVRNVSAGSTPPTSDDH